MLNNLREESSFQEEEKPPEVKKSKPTKPPKPAKQPKPPKPPKPHKQSRSSFQPRSIDQITGMSARQRFILAVMLLIMVCLLGTMFLLITGKIVPPFLG